MMGGLQIENLHVQNDEIMNELTKETENGRLVRILVKLGMMNERPENDMDPGWSETGDRYLLKLFRDFVFHQVWSSPSPNSILLFYLIQIVQVYLCLKTYLGSRLIYGCVYPLV